jgi:hypothetical protein
MHKHGCDGDPSSGSTRIRTFVSEISGNQLYTVKNRSDLLSSSSG